MCTFSNNLNPFFLKKYFPSIPRQTKAIFFPKGTIPLLLYVLLQWTEENNKNTRLWDLSHKS